MPSDRPADKLTRKRFGVFACCCLLSSLSATTIAAQYADFDIR